MPDKLLLFRRENGTLVTILTDDPLPVTINPADYGVERGEMISLVIGVHLGKATSGVPLPLPDEPPAVASVHVSDVQGGSAIASARIGERVWAVASDVSGRPAPVLSYQWRLGGTAISGATGASYTVTAGGTLSVTITADNGVSNPASATSGNVTVEAAAGFNPADWDAVIDPSDLASLSQIIDGMTPVTADGQPVGRLNAGGIYTMTATGDTTRPTYRTEGGLHWIRFQAGSNQWLGVDIGPGNTPLTIVAAWERTGGVAAGFTANSFISAWRGTGSQRSLFVTPVEVGAATRANNANATAVIALPTERRTLVGQWSGVDGPFSLQAEAETASAIMETTAATPQTLSLGRSRNGTGTYATGRLFFAAVKFGTMSEAQIAAAVARANERAGL